MELIYEISKKMSEEIKEILTRKNTFYITDGFGITLGNYEYAGSIYQFINQGLIA